MAVHSRLTARLSLAWAVAAGQEAAMDGARKHDLTEALASALDWWREAGVDHAFGDDPRAWLEAAPENSEALTNAPAAGTTAPKAPEAPPTRGLTAQKDSWPTNLADFAAWWLGEPLLDHGMTAGRIAPRGSAGAPLMVLVEQPEDADTDRLLSGPEGRLLDAFLAAAGIAPDQAYVASVLPRHTPMPDWAALLSTGFAEVTAHHVALAAPTRLIAFGSNILPLLGHDSANKRDLSPVLNHEGQTIPLLPALSLAALLATPRRKAALWRDWLDWTGA
jgi:DNA polymerase